MGKHLSEMTLEELWRLFPIFLTKPNPQWEAYYEEMEALLREKLQEFRVERINHIGSTAIHGIWAKNIVDILLEIAPGEDMDAVSQTLAQAGFRVMSRSEGRVSLNRGYTEEGFAEKVYHLHLRYAGDNDELYFRDYMNERPDLAKEYEQMKLRLWKRFEHDRDGYTEAKTALIRQYTAEAKATYPNRYAPKGSAE